MVRLALQEAGAKELIRGILSDYDTSAKLHKYFNSAGKTTAEAKDLLGYAAFTANKPSLKGTGFLGLVPNYSLPHPLEAGHLQRALTEYDDYTKSLKKRKAIAIAATLAGVLGYGAYKVLGAKDKKPAELLEEHYDPATLIRKNSALQGIAILTILSGD